MMHERVSSRGNQSFCKTFRRLSRDIQLSISRYQRRLLIFLAILSVTLVLVLTTVFDFYDAGSADRGAICGCDAIRKLLRESMEVGGGRDMWTGVVLVVEGEGQRGFGEVVGVISGVRESDALGLLGVKVRWERKDIEGGICGCWGSKGGGFGKYLVVGRDLLTGSSRVSGAEVVEWRKMSELGIGMAELGRGLGIGWDVGRAANRREEINGQVDVSIIAACRDRGEGLQHVLQSWHQVTGVEEIVVVDYGSKYNMRSFSEKVLVVRVDGVSEEGWILSRAYNVAARVARGTWILKVDCDTVLPPDFVERHERKNDHFYAGDWREITDFEKQLHMNGLLFVEKSNFMKVGGYDERIVTYGWEDTDLVNRLANTLRRRTLNLRSVRHLEHTSSARIINQKKRCLLSPENPFAASTEIQRNRILTSKIAGVKKWSGSSPHVRYSIWNPSKAAFPETHFENVTFLITEGVPAILDIVAPEHLEDASKRAIRIVLNRLGAPRLPKSFSLDFYKQVIGERAHPERYANVTVALNGGVAARIIEYAHSIAVIKQQAPPPEFSNWGLHFLWVFPDPPCRCGFNSVFVPKDYLVFDSHSDASERWWKGTGDQEILQVSAKSELSLSDNLRQYTSLVRDNLVRSEVRVSATRNVRLYANAACDEVVTGELRAQLRAELRDLVPHQAIMDAVSRSLSLIQDEALDAINSVEVDAREEDFRSSTWARQLASVWDGGISSLVSHRHHRLARRAAALSSLAQSGGGRGLPAVLRGKLDRMFLGCSGKPKDYLNAYPELTIILSALLSSNVCIAPAEGA